MPAAPEILVHRTAEVLTHATAARLITRLTDLQAAGRVPSVVLTGGTIANDLYRAVADSRARDAVDWSRVDFWWGDERFVPAADSQRNSGQAREALLDRVPVDPARVHEMAPSDGKYGDDVDAAADGYAEELRRAAGGAGETPVFDLLLLGIGENGHCASLMPGDPVIHDRRPVVAVRNSPKPPPTRISLTMGPLMRGRELWFIASGNGKAGPVGAAVAGADVDQVPAAGPKGMDRTLWLLDRDAAAELP
jgi:6-phosphogluconolactonase